MKFTTSLIALALLPAAAGVLAQQQEDLSVLAGWMRFSDAPNALYRHLGAQAFAFLDARRARVAPLHTESQWRERQAEITATLDRIVGPFPERTPLNARVTGVVRKEGYRFETVVFESMPNFFVTGVLLMTEKLCIFCKHFNWSSAEFVGMGSTLTGPMLEGSWAECSKGHFKELQSPEDEVKYRRVILKGKDCPDYDQVDL